MRSAPLVPRGGPVLDLARGGGRHTRLFLDRGHPIIAVDRDVGPIGALGPHAGPEIARADLEGGSPRGPCPAAGSPAWWSPTVSGGRDYLAGKAASAATPAPDEDGTRRHLPLLGATFQAIRPPAGDAESHRARRSTSRAPPPLEAERPSAYGSTSAASPDRLHVSGDGDGIDAHRDRGQPRPRS